MQQKENIGVFSPNRQRKWTKPRNVPSELLELDPLNPRIRAYRSVHPERADNLFDLLYSVFGITDLVMSIFRNGYIASHPLLVIRSPELDGYTVVDGNRRLAAIKLLCNTEAYPGYYPSGLPHPSDALRASLGYMPAIELKDRESYLLAAGATHLNRTETWCPLARAMYVYELHAVHGIPLNEIGGYIGYPYAPVGSLVYPYKLLLLAEQAGVFDRKLIQSRNLYFSSLVQALKDDDVLAYLGIPRLDEASIIRVDMERLGFLLSLLFGNTQTGVRTVVHDVAADLPKLGLVLRSPEATQLLKEQGDLEVAYHSRLPAGGLNDQLRLMENSLAVARRMLKKSPFSHGLMMKVKGIRDRADNLMLEMMEDELL